MARVIYAYPVSELVGSVGGVTFQRNSSGKTARSKPNMVVNPSPAQAGQQYFLSQLVALWPTLTVAEKTSWTADLVPHLHVTPWGESKMLNGYQWFMSCNLNLYQDGYPILHSAPTWSVVSPLPSFNFVANSSSFYLYWGATQNISPDSLFVYLTSPLRQSSIKLRRSLFLVDIKHAFNSDWVNLIYYFQTLVNVNWTTFYNSADAGIICRLIRMKKATGLASSFTSGIIKIP